MFWYLTEAVNSFTVSGCGYREYPTVLISETAIYRKLLLRDRGSVAGRKTGRGRGIL